MQIVPRNWKVLIIALGTIGAALGAGSLMCRRAPFGHFDSRSFMGPHASDDVLTFSNGVVIWQTCCGASPVGSCEPLPDGTWAWHFVMARKKPITGEFVLRPGLFWMTCSPTSNPAKVYRLKRRLSAPNHVRKDDP